MIWWWGAVPLVLTEDSSNQLRLSLDIKRFLFCELVVVSSATSAGSGLKMVVIFLKMWPVQFVFFSKWFSLLLWFRSILCTLSLHELWMFPFNLIRRMCLTFYRRSNRFFFIRYHYLQVLLKWKIYFARFVHDYTSETKLCLTLSSTKIAMSSLHWRDRKDDSKSWNWKVVWIHVW